MFSHSSRRGLPRRVAYKVHRAQAVWPIARTLIVDVPSRTVRALRAVGPMRRSPAVVRSPPPPGSRALGIGMLQTACGPPHRGAFIDAVPCAVVRRRIRPAATPPMRTRIQIVYRYGVSLVRGRHGDSITTPKPYAGDDNPFADLRRASRATLATAYAWSGRFDRARALIERALSSGEGATPRASPTRRSSGGGKRSRRGSGRVRELAPFGIVVRRRAADLGCRPLPAQTDSNRLSDLIAGIRTAVRLGAESVSNCY